jgi:ABC-type Mn2+/Zn2+ transport system permease subunit
VVIPPATARLVTHRFARMLWLSTALGAGGGGGGVLAAYQLDIASGPVIVLTESLCFAVAYAAAAVRAHLERRAPVAPVAPTA